jgi:hypothetical protein
MYTYTIRGRSTWGKNIKKKILSFITEKLFLGFFIFDFFAESVGGYVHQDWTSTFTNIYYVTNAVGGGTMLHITSSFLVSTWNVSVVCKRKFLCSLYRIVNKFQY